MASRKALKKTDPKTDATTASSSLPWWIPPVVFCVLVAVYWPALSGPILFDDIGLPVFREAGPPNWIGYLRGVRPLTNLSLYLNYLVSGRETFPCHLTNLALHFITGGLVLYLLRRLLEMTGSKEREASQLALLGSLVFLFHPLQTEAVSYMASRSESLSTPFAYAALALLVAAGARAVGWARSASILALLAAGTLAKEPVVAMAAVIPLVDFWMTESRGSAGVASNWRLHIPLVAGGVLGGIGVAAYVSSRSGGTAGFSVAGTSWYEYLSTQFKVIWIYIRLFAFPVGQNLDYGFPHSAGLLDPMSILGLAGLISLLALAWKFRRKYPLGSLGVPVFLILLSPTSSVIPIADAAAERRAYLPSIGLLLILTEILRRWPVSRWKNWLIFLLIAVLAVGTWNRNKAYGSEVAMWEDSVRGNPQNFRSWTHLGLAYFKTRRCSDAVKAFEHVEKLGPQGPGFYWDYAAASECDDQIDRAVAKYREAIAIQPQAQTWTLLAGLFERKGRWGEALDALDQAQRLDAQYWQVYSFRGSAYLSLRRFEEAATEYQHALELRPNDEFSLAGLSQAEVAIRYGRAKKQPVSK